MGETRLKSKNVATLLLMLLLGRCVVSNNDIKGDEANYLNKLKKAISPVPPSWSSENMCNWSGVSCISSGGTSNVEEIILDSMSLKGQLPPGFNNSLGYLRRLSLINNYFTGPLPSLVGLISLQDVDLRSNNFTSVPHGCFQNLPNLNRLILYNNNNLAPWTLFSANVTDCLALTTLSLGATNLMGSLPDTLGSLTNLQLLELSSNNLTGSLPKSFAQLINLQTLLLNDQEHGGLSGTIEFLSSMTHLSYVNLERNSFQGPIPDLSNWKDLQELMLGGNKLTGEVQPSVMNFSTLWQVSLENNWLQGPMPLFNRTITTNLSLEGNGFCLDHAGPCNHTVTTLLQVAEAFGYPLLLARTWRGNNPCKRWSFINCDSQDKIRTVNLTKLNLTGTISPAFANLTDLRELYLSGNNLKGSIPESLTSLSQLQIMDVSNNNLSGTIPTFSPAITLNTSNNFYLNPGNSPPKASPPPHPSKTTHHYWIKLGSAAGSVVGVLVIFGVIIFICKRHFNLVEKIMLRRERQHGDHYFENLIESYGSLSLKRYTYKEVKNMTNSFKEKLGEGGYGIVYKASLANGQQVAVKILKESKGSVKEFVDEAFIISRTSHVNIVSLLGFCYDKNKKALIYEFIHNDSLDKFACRKDSSSTTHNLDWKTLYQISIGIARGLEYLHRGCNTRILHLDIKPQNILLDEHFRPKIADFGLAKICKKDQSIVSIMGTRGTPGYIAPEIFSRVYGEVSHKSDVYSYGMLILEIIGGRRNYYENVESQASEICFPDWIYKDLEQGNFPTNCLPHREEENDIARKMTLVSLWCIQPNPLNRPSISDVIDMLEGPVDSIPYPPKPDLFSSKRFISQDTNVSSSNRYETNSTTEEIVSKKR
ncbi:hypothetical protein PIB30_069478 [Stylosanthes scabra]|uniref:Protein kinase domain-containing protein n=1 Tax=Stylosanthes scabra TaxID=79078 RepID=A0ABU6WLH4_9FABA|nr:hypothetical protein [Stylosanthes scabra]